MTRFLLSFGLGVIVCDILGVFGRVLPQLPWVKWLPILSLAVFPVFVLYLLRRGIASAARDLSTAYDRFALVALASWILAYFWGLFMEFPEPQRWGIWLAMVLLVWRLVEVLSQKGHEASRQAQLAAEARGLALRSRLAPHFLFNSLATLKAQLRRDPEGAEDSVDHLAAMFRQLVEVADLTRIPLRRELEFIDAYLSLERARFGSRLQVAFDVPEELEDWLIPPLSLQVLVENAVKHGVSALEQGGEVAISVRDRAGALELQVADPGPGFVRSQAHPTGTGTALDTLRLRLQGAGDVSFERVEGRHIARLVLYAGRTQTG